jgi:hormone-sensitive lipase
MAELSTQNLSLCKSIETLQDSKKVPESIQISFKVLSNSLHSFNTSSHLSSGNQTFGSYSQTLINNYLNQINNLLSSCSSPLKSIEKVDLRSLIDKLKLLINCLPFSYSLPEDDLECLDESHQRKQALNSIIEIKNKHPEIVQKQTKEFLIKYDCLKAAFLKTCQFRPNGFRNIWTTAWIVYFTLNRKEREKYAKLYNVIGKIDAMKMIWDLTESPLMRKMFPLIFPRIKMSKYIFIPRNSVKITEKGRFPDPSLVKGSKFSEVFNENTIPVNILSSSKKTLTTDRKYTKLIIHIHGGGFIGQSTFSHQPYLRKWSNHLKLPIFSIDYRLAPKHKFPEGLDDAWQAYIW